MALVILMVPLSIAVDWSGLHGLADIHGRVEALYQEATISNEQTASLANDTNQAGRLLVELLADNTAADSRIHTAQLAFVTIPAVNADIARLQHNPSVKSSGSLPTLDRIAGLWQQFLTLEADPAVASLTTTPAVKAALTNRTAAISDPIAQLTGQLVNRQEGRATAAFGTVQHSYDGSQTELLLVAGIVILAGVSFVGWLIMVVVPRVHSYSRFALRVAEGNTDEELRVTGNDDLTDLGHALNEMVRNRITQQDHEAMQAEFGYAMQCSDTEEEAYELLQRHVQASIPESRVTTLSRNNSADRLVATTPLSDDSRLKLSLTHAKPRSCLAVRYARGQTTQPDRRAVVECAVCGKTGERTTCMPLLVGGEVIGSMLTLHDRPLAEDEQWTITESVSQAAPVLANLRNLAIAEKRADTDALTGLPNRRTVEHTVKRMVAQAGRRVMPLAVLAIDLDHFKQINDGHGHGKGDEVLATAAGVMRSTLRDSDFVGRTGGEEFLALLPDTGLEAAKDVAEKIRQGVSTIEVSSVEQQITVSVGIAVLPDHASDSETLVRHGRPRAVRRQTQRS